MYNKEKNIKKTYIFKSLKLYSKYCFQAVSLVMCQTCTESVNECGLCSFTLIVFIITVQLFL